jgi:hypothetical protein
VWPNTMVTTPTLWWAYMYMYFVPMAPRGILRSHRIHRGSRILKFPLQFSFWTITYMYFLQRSSVANLPGADRVCAVRGVAWPGLVGSTSVIVGVACVVADR